MASWHPYSPHWSLPLLLLHFLTPEFDEFYSHSGFDIFTIDLLSIKTYCCFACFRMLYESTLNWLYLTFCIQHSLLTSDPFRQETPENLFWAAEPRINWASGIIYRTFLSLTMTPRILRFIWILLKRFWGLCIRKHEIRADGHET